MNQRRNNDKKRMNKMDAKQKMMAISIVAVVMMCACFGAISAKTGTVCKGGGDFEIIQDAIDMASTGNILYGYEITCPNIFDVIENEAHNEAVNGTPFSPPLYALMGTYCPPDNDCLTYQEYQRIDVIEPWNNNYVDENNWWMQQRPRGGANVVPITLYRCNATNETWEGLRYDVNLFNWSSANLTPEDIPTGAQYHAGFKVGHENGSGGWPELANFRGNGYVRITDYPPACYGGSFRPLAHNMFFDDEDFPILTKVYSNVISTNKATSVFKVESEDFTGVLSADMQFYPPSDGVKIEVVSKYYSRKNLSISTENVSIIALNSMLWLDENDTPETPNDEAHDSDTVMIHYSNGTWVTHQFDNPTSELSIITLGRVESGDKIYIAQQDRDPSHYEKYRPESPYAFRSSYSINILYTNRPDLVVKIYEDKTNDEWADNILVATELTNNLTQGEEIHIEYILEAYYGPGVKITSIDGNRTFINIGWEATDPEGLPINITIEFGDGTDDGWIPIVENTSNDGLYRWNTTDITPGHYYLKISAINSKGDIGWDIADTIINHISGFDTGNGTYPSIFGIHNGKIIPSHNIFVSKMYTYPCGGTGGLSKYVKFWNETWDGVEACWTGYQGDWHNITFNESFTLKEGITYYYTIRTGSYPQIHHNKTLNIQNGMITCTEFVDTNGKKYDDWIPAIRLE
ncbi:glucans biosynthesis protein [Candidatus Methanophagaceae archaeon]|nr:glucans biosynthesis protein [Methanophagales archaeon]